LAVQCAIFIRGTRSVCSERFKPWHRPDNSKEKKQKEEKRLEFKTEEEAATKEIGQWQIVETK